MNTSLALLLTGLLAAACLAQAPATQPAVKLPTLASSNPLFFKVVFGPKATDDTMKTEFEGALGQFKGDTDVDDEGDDASEEMDDGTDG